MKHRRIRFFVYTIALLFLFYEMALQVSPSVMTQQLYRDFHIDAKTLGIMAGFYFYSYTLMQVPAGIFFDYFGPRLLITLSTLVCALGALFFGTTKSIELASLGRLLMGVGSAFAFIGVLVVAARFFAQKRFAMLVGIAQLLAALGALGGEVPLSHAVDTFGWRSTMEYLAYFGFLLTILSLLIVRDRPKGQKIEHHHVSFLKSMKEIFSHGQTYWIGIYAFALWAPVATYAALWGVPFLVKRHEISTFQAAIVVGMIWLGIGLTSPFLGYLSDRIGKRVILLRLSAALGLLASMIIIYVPGNPLWVSYIFHFLFGMAAAGQILSFALVKDNNRAKFIGTAVGFNNMAVVAGGALFQPLVGYLIDLHWKGVMEQGIPLYTLENYTFALIVVPLVFLLGLIASLFFIKETYCKQRYALPHESKLV